MKYRIARQSEDNTDGLSIIMTEFLSWSDGEAIEFDKKEDCERYCDGMGIGVEHIWEEEDEIS
tara:strand:- start:404 stop:592 length:189 start_codon:yes stop_codon:yes gene_type:complete